MDYIKMIQCHTSYIIFVEIEKYANRIILRGWYWLDVVIGENRIIATQKIFENFVEMFYLRVEK